MLVSCRYCSAFHNRGESCPNRPRDKRTKDPTYISRFRSSRAWQKKRDEIKDRDKFLCLHCRYTKGVYVFNGLSVHHIRPLSKAWAYRLENSNLITLCRLCHEDAEKGNIRSSILGDLVKNAYSPETPFKRP